MTDSKPDAMPKILKNFEAAMESEYDSCRNTFMVEHEEELRRLLTPASAEDAARLTTEGAEGLNVDDLANEIRRLDGDKDLAAGALAEGIIDYLASRGLIADNKKLDDLEYIEAVGWIDAYEKIPTEERDSWLVMYARKAMRDLTPFVRAVEKGIRQSDKDLIEKVEGALRFYARKPGQSYGNWSQLIDADDGLLATESLEAIAAWRGKDGL